MDHLQDMRNVRHRDTDINEDLPLVWIVSLKPSILEHGQPFSLELQVSQPHFQVNLQTFDIELTGNLIRTFKAIK